MNITCVYLIPVVVDRGFPDIRATRNAFSFSPGASIRLDLGEAQYAFNDPSLLRETLSRAGSVEIVATSEDVIDKVRRQLVGEPGPGCPDCVDWLPCPDHMVK